MTSIQSFLLSLLITTSCCIAQNRPDPLQPPIPMLPKADLPSVGMRPDTIARVIDLIRSIPPRDFRALVVIKNNKLVVEEYFNTYWRETIHDIRSAGKGITALLLGIAIDKGLVKSKEQSIYDFFEGKKFNAPDASHKSIKIKHLLNMSSGLYVDDDNNNAPGNTANWLLKDDWVNFATAVPMAFKPGEKYVYADICPMLIGAIIEQTSGKKLSVFAKENLFDPLGIREFYWYTAPNGSTASMGNLYLSAVDFAKIGQVVIGNGKWQEKKIVSESWIKEIASVNFDISGEGPFAQGYGTFWFKTTKKVDGKQYECLFASGNGGNLLFVVPSENLVVSLLSSAYGGGHARSHAIFETVLRALE